jgi:hypothetical protein
MRVILSSIGLYLFLAISWYNLLYADTDYSSCNSECLMDKRASVFVQEKALGMLPTCFQICKLRIDLKELLKDKKYE